MFLIEGKKRAEIEAEDFVCSSRRCPERRSRGDAGSRMLPRGIKAFGRWNLGLEKGWRDEVALGQVERG